MRVGTKSVLFGYHAFWLHPFMVAEAWRRIHGFPWDPRLWVAFLVHDIGYLGCADMDGKQGPLHPFMGAGIMAFLFDWVQDPWKADEETWHDFVLCHSRQTAERYFKPWSKLCAPDKLAFLLYPRWLLRCLYWMSGELEEYRRNTGGKSFDEWYERVRQDSTRALRVERVFIFSTEKEIDDWARSQR